MDRSTTASSANFFDSQLENAKIHAIDIVVIVAYFVVIVIIGLWSTRRTSNTSVSSYFLANRSMNWILVGTSLFASNIGSGHFIGLAGAGASSGIANYSYELFMVFILMLLGWIFVPVYTSAGVNTMPEYLRLRFGGQRIRVYLSLLSLLLYVFTKISVDLFSGAIFIKQALNLNMYISVGVLLTIAALFTIAGGLMAVMWTELVQTIFMLTGATYLAVLSLYKVGGYKELMNNFAISALPTDPEYMLYRDNCTPTTTTNNSCISCSAVTPYYNHLIRPVDDKDLPITGLLFGLTTMSMWYWCTDQVIVQRVLSAKNVSHAKGGCILASYFKLSPLFLMVLPGMAARVLWPNEVGCSNPVECKRICGSESGCSNIAYPMLILNIMPAGAIGLMLSVIMAALMSSLTSIFNSASTIFTIDIWTRIRKNPGEMEQVIVGRVFVLILVVISIIWIPIIEASQGSKLFDYMNSIQSYLAPPVVAIFLLGIFWQRTNEKGAFWGLMTGLFLGLIRFIMEFSYKEPLCGSEIPDPRPAILTKVHFLHFGIILFIITCLVTVIISLMTDPIDAIHLYRLTFQTKYSDKVRVDIDSEKQPINKRKTKTVISIDECENCLQTNQSDINNRLTVIRNSNNPTNYMKYFYALCCMSSKNKGSSNDANGDQENIEIAKRVEARRLADAAKEEPLWKNVNNIGAVIVISIAAFIFGFYA